MWWINKFIISTENIEKLRDSILYKLMSVEIDISGLDVRQLNYCLTKIYKKKNYTPKKKKEEVAIRSTLQNILTT